MPPRIFISYRRADAAGDAGRLSDHVQKRFGADRVFLDIDTIEPGTDFVKVLQRSLEETAVMLVVIGPRWTSVRSDDGTRRIDAADDFVRMEVEAALRRDIPVVPVLVQGASVPQPAELPPSLAALSTRQAAALDHAEFHDDAERLCDRIARVVEPEPAPRHAFMRRWWPAAAVVAAGVAASLGYSTLTGRTGEPAGVPPTDDRVQSILEEASAQRRRNQYAEALTTVAKARELAPAATNAREVQEDIAMEWIRNVRVEDGRGTFTDAVKPPLAVIDAALPSASGPRRADLLAHSGWATFLMWRDGDRRLDPVVWYRDALSLDAGNPYANAMLAHWILFQSDDVAGAVALFDKAAAAGRALDDVRVLQWAAYANDKGPEADVQLVRLADAMRRNGEKLTPRQSQTLWAPYYFALSPAQGSKRDLLLGAVAPDEHISTLRWAFDAGASQEESRRRAVRFYVALLHAKAGRQQQAREDLRALDAELARTPGTLQDAVQASLGQLQRAPAR